MRHPIVWSLLLVSILSGTIACGDDETPTGPTTPERTATTETFDGRITVNGAFTQPFVANGSGLIQVTLTALSPDSAARVGLSLGTFNQTGACQTVIANDNATQGVTVSGNAGGAGTFCARVYDVGQLTAPTDYTLTVSHF